MEQGDSLRGPEDGLDELLDEFYRSLERAIASRDRYWASTTERARLRHAAERPL